MWKIYFTIFVVFYYGVDTIHSSLSSPPRPQVNTGVREFDVAKDAQDLHAAMVGIGTDENAIIRILTNRTNMERQRIAQSYFQQFEKNLLKDLKQELSGKFRQVVMGLMLEPTEYLVKEIHDALEKLLTDDRCVVAILCTKTRYELKSIMETYKFLYNKTLLSDIEENATGEYKMFMRNLLTPKMRDVGNVNATTAKFQAQYIPTSTDDCGMSTNIRFMEMVTKETFEQLRYVIHEYENTHNTTADSALNMYCNDRLLVEAYTTILDYAKNPASYYAKLINTAVVGIGTNDDVLIRTIISRQEIDLNDIKYMYERMYKTTLSSAVASETSGYYKKILLALIGPEK